jgi:aquaporin Z
MVSATAAISGGHLNPAVTVGAFVARKISLPAGAAYIVAQCLGGVAGALMVSALLYGQVIDPQAIHNGTPAPAPGYPWYLALGLEAVLTFFLMFVIYGTAIDARAPRVGGLFIGLTVGLDILAGGPLTGAAMNPARWLGPALVDGHLGDFAIYWVGPILGAVVAALIWHLFLEKSPAQS